MINLVSFMVLDLPIAYHMLLKSSTSWAKITDVVINGALNYYLNGI